MVDGGMKKIYIVLTHSGSMLSKLIKVYTKDEFTHVSISLDKDLNEMYSFGRLKPYNPLIGGFVHEQRNDGTYKRFKKTKAKVYSLEISDDQFNCIKKIIFDMKKENKKYHFNAVGLFAVAFHLKIKRNRRFYCAEFIKYLMDESKVEMELPDLVRPSDFTNIETSNIIFSGLLSQYN